MSEEEVDFNPPPLALAESFSVGATRDTRDDLGSSTVEKREGGEKEGEYFCGCGAWHPPRLQVFRDARVFTFLLCLFATIEGAIVSGNLMSI